MQKSPTTSLPHANILLGELLQARIHDTLRRCSEGGASTASLVDT